MSALKIRRYIANMIDPSLEKELVLARIEKERAFEDAVSRIDPKNIMRQVLGLVTLDMEAPDDFLKDEKLTSDDLRNLYAWGSGIKNNRWWAYLRAWLLNSQAGKTLQQTDSTNIWIGKGTINGILMVDEVVERLANLYEASKVEQDKYDKHALVPDTY